MLDKLERQTEDGATARWVLTSKVPIRDRAGKIVALVGSARDVTERRRAEEARRESEARFQAFMDHKPAAASMKDEAGRYVYANRAFQDILGRAPGELLGKTDADWLPADTAARLGTNVRTVIATGACLQAVETVPLADGPPREWLSFKFPFTDADGRRFVGGVSLDVTERQREALELERLAAIVASSNDPIIGWAPDGRISSWNPA